MTLQHFGANKGIGFGKCKQLAYIGIKMVITARDEKKDLEAVEKLKGSGMSDYLGNERQIPAKESFLMEETDNRESKARSRTQGQEGDSSKEVSSSNNSLEQVEVYHEIFPSC
ncbi:hypothetical protein SESBI_42190 [Sesbania bispinosa]|nr:hypothetical protein SESBI_42190 [Sesbania bispinosa]